MQLFVKNSNCVNLIRISFRLLIVIANTVNAYFSIKNVSFFKYKIFFMASISTKLNFGRKKLENLLDLKGFESLTINDRKTY